MEQLKSRFNGDWRESKNIHINDNGAWKEAKRAYIKDGGEWKLMYAGPDNNELSYSGWKIGENQTTQISGDIIYNLNGDGNKIIDDTDPFGKTVAVWQTVDNDIDSNADGGWQTKSFAIDRTFSYRFSVWVKRPVDGNGHFYLGTHAFNSAGTNSIRLRTSSSTTTNPYFEINVHWGEWGNNTDWYLVVGHVWRYGTDVGAIHIDSGIYDTNGNKVKTIENDYQWLVDSVTADHRTYLFYSTDTTTDQRWVYPRVDKLDGTEPSISQLIRSNEARSLKKSCKEWLDSGSTADGIYVINPTGLEEFEAYCDMTTDGGGWTLVFYSNSDNVSRSYIDSSDWNTTQTINFSRLWSFRNIKSSNQFEFFIHDSSTVFRNNIFRQDNSYLESPVNNNYVQTGGNFYYSAQASGWRGFALGSFGNNAMVDSCALAMSYEGNSWHYCLQDQLSGNYGTGPWFYDSSNGGYDAGSQQWVKVYQR